MAYAARKAAHVDSQALSRSSLEDAKNDGYTTLARPEQTSWTIRCGETAQNRSHVTAAQGRAALSNRGAGAGKEPQPAAPATSIHHRSSVEARRAAKKRRHAQPRPQQACGARPPSHRSEPGPREPPAELRIRKRRATTTAPWRRSSPATSMPAPS